MKKTFIEVIKENKKTIIKHTLIIGGTIVGLAVALLLVPPITDGEYDEELEEFVDIKDDESDDEE